MSDKYFTVNIRDFWDKKNRRVSRKDFPLRYMSVRLYPKIPMWNTFYYIMRLSLPKKINLSLIWYLMLKMLHWLVFFHLQ